MRKRTKPTSLSLASAQVSPLKGFCFFSWALGRNFIILDNDYASAVAHFQDWLSAKGLDSRLIPLSSYEPDSVVKGSSLKHQVDCFRDDLNTMF